MSGRSTIVGIAAVALLLAIIAGCASKSSYPPDVDKALESAGDNRAELEKVITHYAAGPDTLKLKAAYFLIGNMEGHCYVTYALEDTLDTVVDFDPLAYPDYQALTTAFDSLEKLHGVLDFKKKDKIDDLKVIKADFLIDQIDYAFKAWREKSWARALSFTDFCEYVLPYRGSNEPLEPWRRTLYEKYAGIEDSLSDPSDPIGAACRINDDVKTWFGFDPRYYYHPTDQGLSEMRAAKLGRCEDMTNLTIYAMCANGLAVTSDYTPHWANAGNNHAWNAILTAQGKVVPFMGAEANPGSYQLANKPAKVYRKTFASQPDNLILKERKQDKVPGWLAGQNYIDVTKDYEDVCDVTVTFSRDLPDSVDIAYLCVFNSGEWSAIHWGRINGDASVFSDMGKGIAYLPALYLNEKIVPWGDPFILQPDGQIRTLRADTGRTITVSLSATTGRALKASTDGIVKSFLTPGQEYELFYMADQWQSLGTAVAGNEPLEFPGAPADGLYWLVAKDSDREERIFTIEDGRQVWW